MERFKFLSIFMSNLDEFYRVRAGMLCDRVTMNDEERDDKAGRTSSEQLYDIFKDTKNLIPGFNNTYSELINELEDFGVKQLIPDGGISEEDRAFLKNSFEHNIAPLISPFIIEKKHPFPFFENGQIIVGVSLQTKNGNIRFGLIPITRTLPKIIFLPGEKCRFILIEDLIFLFAHKVFHKFTIIENIIFSIIRNADIDENEGLYDYDIDLRNTISKLIERRNILAPVKIKYSGDNCKRIMSHLCKVLYLKKRQVFKYSTPLDLRFISDIGKKLPQNNSEKLYYPPATPLKCREIDENANIIDQIMLKDVLLSYPFEDISAMVSLIEQAANDERVASIYMTLYRVAGNSKILAALMNAAKNGKSVTCVVELRARFDEENNIDWAGRLQEAGCKVLFGPPMYKVHAKLLLIELDSTNKKRICLVGTGNFNEITAKIYTDMSLLTAHRGISDDVKKIFTSIEKGEFVKNAKHLIVAPLKMKSRLIELIDNEIAKKHDGKQALIILKLNSLTEKDLIDKLCEASQAGVKIRMIIRGICCLIPGIPGFTENIEIRSVVGRFLEHTRIYSFGAGNERRYFLSSADWMTRNTTQRIEAAVPVYDKGCKEKIKHMLDLNFADNVNARIMKPNGSYERAELKKQSRVDCQTICIPVVSKEND